MHICKMYAAYLQLIKTDSEQCLWKNHKHKNLPTLLSVSSFSSISKEGLNLQQQQKKLSPISRNISYYASWPTYLNNQPTNIFI